MMQLCATWRSNYVSFKRGGGTKGLIRSTFSSLFYLHQLDELKDHFLLSSLLSSVIYSFSLSLILMIALAIRVRLTLRINQPSGWCDNSIPSVFDTIEFHSQAFHLIEKRWNTFTNALLLLAVALLFFPLHFLSASSNPTAECLFHFRLISPSTGSCSTRLRFTERRRTKMKSWSSKMSSKLTKWVCLCCCCCLIHWRALVLSESGALPSSIKASCLHATWLNCVVVSLNNLHSVHRRRSKAKIKYFSLN